MDIAIALDVSGSMGETDFEPHRLAAAKAIISDFIEERKYDRIGLVVFSREAFIQSPPTLDHGALIRLLRDVYLANEMGIEDGTAIGSGMATAANMLKDSSAESKLVTLDYRRCEQRRRTRPHYGRHCGGGRRHQAVHDRSGKERGRGRLPTRCLPAPGT